MTTRRKAGALRKKPAAKRKKVSAPRARRSTAKTSRTQRAAYAPRATPPVFPAECTIAQANEMKAGLARLLAAPGCVTLDLSPIRRVDTAAMQVLAAFIRERRAAGNAVECRGATEPFLDTANVLGLADLFGAATP